MDNDDAIADTEHQMREEKFETQFFSPTKPNAASRKKHKPDAAATRIRGDIGAAINKAIRKSNRDLTMLRSHGQTLLQQSKDAHGGGRAGLDNVQDRHHVVVCLRRHRPHASQTIYDGSVNAVSSEINAPCKERARVRVVFTPQTAAHLSVKPGMLVKIYEPFHFVPIVRAAGFSSANAKWLLVGTNLSEVL